MAASDSIVQGHDFGLVTCDADIYPENRARIEAAGRRALASLEAAERSPKPGIPHSEVMAKLERIKQRQQKQG